MTKDRRFVLGILIVFAALVAYALLADAARDKGAVVWIVVAAIGLGLILPATKFPGYRRWLESTIRGGFEAIAEIFSSPPPEGEFTSERQAVKPGMRNWVIGRAQVRCQAPECEKRGRKNLHVHHIDMNHANSSDENNLIALCPDHHHEAHRPRSGVTPSRIRNGPHGKILHFVILLVGPNQTDDASQPCPMQDQTYLPES